MLRTFFALSFAVLYLILTIPMLGIEWIIGHFNKPLMDRSSLRAVQWAFRVINRICGVSLTVIGEERLPEGEACLYVCNHQSYFDIIIGYTLRKELTGYIAKDSIQKVPLLNIWMKRLYCLFMNRDSIKESLKTILEAAELIKKGISVTIFPEGTRGDGITLQSFKEGSMKIAEKTGCPIIPMAITNTKSIIGDHMPRVEPTHVIIEYGDPIYPKELDRAQRKALGSYTREVIQEIVDRNRKLI